MEKIKLNIADERMLLLAEMLQQKNEIRFKQQLWDVIKIKKQNISNIRAGNQHFTLKQIQRACKNFHIDANWILGLHNDMPVTKKVTKFKKDFY